jgi:N-acetylglucosamine PTS system EIICBA or EIICB component
LTDGGVQVVVGPIADQLASQIRAAMRTSGNAGAIAPTGSKPVPVTGAGVPSAAMKDLIQALGGRANIAAVRFNASRLCVTLNDPDAIDETALGTAVRAMARPTPDSVHLILGPAAREWAAALQPA